ncbi:MAG TPA: T9SS type A sorting domain-containing protein [Bacteroidales bacterium]|nr:T9SS type A sorting domain-containing protein [Bacteroidales bacterium]
MKNQPFKQNRRRWIATGLMIILSVAFSLSNHARAQIYEPEGLNMPGGWNGWTNPPVNNLALASSTQVTGGHITKFPVGQVRWQTIFSVAASGGDIIGGTYEWLFTSGPSNSPWNNKWSAVNVEMNTLQTYTKQGSNNNVITVVNGKWYTMNWEDNNYTNTRAIFMETSAEPVQITNVTIPVTVYAGDSVIITITVSQTPSPEERFFLRISTDDWNSSYVRAVTMNGTSGTATIPGQPAGTGVSYYVFSSTVAEPYEDCDLYTIRLNNNQGSNCHYLVTNPPAAITFANLESPASGTIPLGDPFVVYGSALIPGITGQATQAPGLEAWFGYSTVDSDPSGWTNWVPATFFGPLSGKDEFTLNLGASLTTVNTYYFATRFRLNTGSYFYGGYSASGGGFWNGTTNTSGSVVVQAPEVPVSRTVQNVTVASEQNLCYDAKATLTLAGGGAYFVVQNGGSVTLVSGGQILMLPGTAFNSGGYVHAYITPVGEYCSALKMPEVKETAISGDMAGTEPVTVSVFPNPAAETVTIHLTGISTPCQAEIYNLRGDRVKSVGIRTNSDTPVSVSDLPSGIFCVRVMNDHHQITKMFVKQ